MASSDSRAGGGREYISPDHLMGGYYVFARRFFFLFGLLLVGMSVDYLGGPLWMATVAAGLSIGPLILLEQWFARRWLDEN